MLVYDNLVAPESVNLASVHAQRCHIGKKAAEHSLLQAETNALPVALA